MRFSILFAFVAAALASPRQHYRRQGGPVSFSSNGGGGASSSGGVTTSAPSSAPGLPSSFVVSTPTSSVVSTPVSSGGPTASGGPNTITFPPAGIILFIGETITITWGNLVGLTVTIQLYVSVPVGTSGRRSLAKRQAVGQEFTLVGTIANDVANTGEFDWTIPDLPNGNNYVIGLEFSADGGANDGTANSFSGAFGIFAPGTNTNDVTIINVNTDITIINTTINITNIFNAPYYCPVCPNPPQPIYTTAPVPYCPPATTAVPGTATTDSSSSTETVSPGDQSGSGSDTGSTPADNGGSGSGTTDSTTTSPLTSQNMGISGKAGLSHVAVLALGAFGFLL